MRWGNPEETLEDVHVGGPRKGHHLPFFFNSIIIIVIIIIIIIIIIVIIIVIVIVIIITIIVIISTKTYGFYNTCSKNNENA